MLKLPQIRSVLRNFGKIFSGDKPHLFRTDITDKLRGFYHF
jgi:hypothetical protein